ncbi:protein TRIGALACTOSYLDIACYLGLYCEROL 4 chloroplastic [Tripterygium wilfordii]|uniref:Protein TRIGALACTOSYLDIACYLGLYCEROL 4 chloroplastic n=1 Tax=Tripterygium wilfordii TaxID=458696 RepID=A0A7J7CBR8_TRIWF|nr:protein TRIGALACTOSYLDIACYLGLYCEROL 4, chloroplastic [Tripterygium wilfordii]KAF5731569.1 protein TRIGALACTOSYLDIACYLGLYCEROL 4 chloroplastic [Tripterygium wilfordii]
MANLRTAMDSQFWDQNVASPQFLDGCARSVPGHPFPQDGTRASRALRMQQLSIMGMGFPLGIIPSYSPVPHHKELGSFSLQSLLLRLETSNWWLGLIGQFRPKKLISAVKKEIARAEEFGLPVIKEAAKQFLDKSLYSIGLSSQFSLSSSSSLLLSTERHGEKKKNRYKMMLFHQLPEHDITLEAAWPELFIDHKGKYWEVPESISLDLSSLGSGSGLRYRFGIHKNTGDPYAVNAIDSEVPFSLMPGLCAKAAFSYDKSVDLWRQKEKLKDVVIRTNKAWYLRPSYDVFLREPHAAVSGVIGGTCAAWFGGGESPASVQTQGGEDVHRNIRKRSPLIADLFGSVCCTFQHGRFKKDYGDLTRVDARLDICSASALASRVFNVIRSPSVRSIDNPLSSPRLNLIFQQQIAGPIVFRLDSRFSLSASSEKSGPHMEDLICSLNYSLRLLSSGKVVAWYSPKRKEGMIELRLFEF